MIENFFTNIGGVHRRSNFQPSTLLHVNIMKTIFIFLLAFQLFSIYADDAEHYTMAGRAFGTQLWTIDGEEVCFLQIGHMCIIYGIFHAPILFA